MHRVSHYGTEADQHYPEEWQIVDLAAAAYNKVTVALYDTLGPRAVGEPSPSALLFNFPSLTYNALSEYVINHAELSVVFCSSNHIADLIKNSANCPTLKLIVSFDPIDADMRASLFEPATKTGVQIREMAERE